MYKFNRLALLASVCFCVSAQAQITQIQGSDTISGSRTTINNNFSYLNSKQLTGTGVPSSGTCSSGTVGVVYTDTNPGGLFYVCMHVGGGYSWITPSTQNAVLTTGSYPDPSWLPTLNWSKLINIPSFPNSQLQINGSNLPQRANTNLIPSTGVTITASDSAATNTTTLTFSASGGGGGGSGTVNNGIAGQLAVYQSSGNAVSGVTPSGDASINVNTGAVAVTKTGGNPFAASATTDTTNPANIPYTSPANGASASNLKNVANNILTPDSFGCHMIADSATDNSCIASAINTALGAGNNIRIPAPNNTTSGSYHYYAVKSPIVVNLRSHTSTDINQGLTIECDGSGTTIAYTGADSTQGLFKFIGSSGAGLDNVTIKNCTLASAVNAQYVVQFSGVSGPRMSDVNIRAANGVTVQYGVQYLGSQQGAILGGSNTNSQTGVYLGPLFSGQSGTTTTNTTATVLASDATISLTSCGALTGSSPNNVFIIDSEHIRASSCSTGTVTVARTCGQLGTALCRGTEGTQPASHASGALVTTGSTITSNQITIAGGVQMICQQNCVYADGIDDGLLAGNSLTNTSGNSGVLINGTGNGSYKVWGNDITAPAGTAVYVLGGKADITGTKGSGSAMLNCATGYCFFHDNQNVSGSITYSSSSAGSYFDNVLTNTNQSQITLNSPSLIAWNNSLPSDVSFSTLSHLFRLDSPIVVTSNYTPPGGDIASLGVNASAPATGYGMNISGSSTTGQYAYLRFNKGMALGVAQGSQSLLIGTDDTFSGMIASFGNSITLNRSATTLDINATGPSPYKVNGVAGVAGQASIGSCQFTFNGILTAGVGSSPITCGYYQTILNGTSPMTQRAKLEFTGSGVSVSDNGTDTTIVTISGGSGASTFDQLGTGINTTATMTVGSGASITTSGTGVVNANKVNGATIPASQPCLASNTTGQLIDCTAGGTNLITDSSNLASANWTDNSLSVSSSSQTGPDGSSITAWSFNDQAVPAAHNLTQGTVAMVSGTTYTITMYAKPVSGAPYHFVYIFSGDDSSTSNVFFDVQACTVGTVNVHMSNAAAVAESNGWCRISVDHASQGSNLLGIGVTNLDNNTVYGGYGSPEVYIFFPQAYPPSGASSVIYGPTLPVSCAIGNVFVLTTGTPSGQVYACTAAGDPGTWTPQGTSSISIQQGGSAQGTANTFNCSTNVTCSVSGGTVTVTSTGGSSGGGNANVPTATFTSSTVTLFSQCTTSGAPCYASKGGTQVDTISSTNTLSAPASGSGTIYVYWGTSGCGIIAPSGTSITAAGTGPCNGVTSTAGTAFPADSTAIIASATFAAGVWSGVNNFQPTASNQPITATGFGLLSSTSAGTKTLSVDTSSVPDISSGVLKLPPAQPLSFYGSCSSGNEGKLAVINDSTTATWGAVITGNGSDHVLGYCDGINWTVAAL